MSPGVDLKGVHTSSSILYRLSQYTRILGQVFPNLLTDGFSVMVPLITFGEETLVSIYNINQTPNQPDYHIIIV